MTIVFLYHAAAAAICKDVAARIQDEQAAIERANEAFYRAFEARDLEAMGSIWADREYAGCILPGQGLVSGWKEIRESLAALFGGTGKIRFRLGDLHVVQRGDLAWISVVENVHHGDDVLIAVQATNLFERGKDDWRMILHHASPISDDAGEPDTNFLQ